MNELNGLTYKKNEIKDLTAKLIFLIENKNIRKKFGQNGRKYVLENFNQQEINSVLENLIFN